LPNKPDLHKLKAGDLQKLVTRQGLTYLISHMINLAEDILEIVANENITTPPSMIDAHHIHLANNLARDDLNNLQHGIDRDSDNE
jgi:hypothetical protein